MSNIHSSHGTIPCPKCEQPACLHHMTCHHCGYQVRIADREASQ